MRIGEAETDNSVRKATCRLTVDPRLNGLFGATAAAKSVARESMMRYSISHVHTSGIESRDTEPGEMQ